MGTICVGKVKQRELTDASTSSNFSKISLTYFFVNV